MKKIQSESLNVENDHTILVSVRIPIKTFKALKTKAGQKRGALSKKIVKILNESMGIKDDHAK